MSWSKPGEHSRFAIISVLNDVTRIQNCMLESQIYFLKRQNIMVNAQVPWKKVSSLTPALWLFSNFAQLGLQEGSPFLTFFPATRVSKCSEKW